MITTRRQINQQIRTYFLKSGVKKTCWRQEGKNWREEKVIRNHGGLKTQTMK